MLLVGTGGAEATSLLAICWPEVSKLRGRDDGSVGKEKGCGEGVEEDGGE